MSTQNIVPAAPAAPPAVVSAPVAPVASPQAPVVTQSPVAPAVKAELKSEDFGSLQEYAQALVARKQEEMNAPAAEVPQVSDPGKEQQATAPDAPEKVAPQEGDTKEAAPAVEEEQDLTKAPDGLELESLDAVQLNEAVKANPKLAEALKEDPQLKASMFRNARLAAETSKYREVFPDVESAQAAAGNSAALLNLDQAFFGIKSAADVDAFIDKHWMEAARLKNQDGTVALDAQGRQKLHPAFDTMMRTITERGIDRGRQEAIGSVTKALDELQATAETDGDSETLTALEAVRERILKPSSPAPTELPPDVKAAQAEVARREGELARRDTEAQQAERTRIDKKVVEDCSTRIQSLISPAIDSSSLTDFEKDSVREKAEDAIVAAIGKHHYWQSAMGQLMLQSPTDKLAEERVNLTMKTVQGLAGPIVAGLLKQAGAQKLVAVQTKEAKVADQIDRTKKTETVSTSGPAQPTQVLSPEKLFEKIKADYQTEHGEEPNAQKMIELWALARRGGK